MVMASKIAASCYALWALLFAKSTFSNAFSPSRVSLPKRANLLFRGRSLSSFPSPTRLAAESPPSTESDSTATFQPLFDFTSEEPKAIESFERIDDAIMGGISTSAMSEVPGKPYAAWSGVCRIDGGGFCGTRTLPFESPLQVGDANGFYLECCLASDDEPERRVWKMVTRTEASRGEEVYQASYEIPKAKDWVRIQIPFTDFKQVRGPRLLSDGVPLNVTGGLYQIGLSLSKFVMSETPKELDNFRPGYFELRLRAIGLYKDKADDSALSSVETPTTLNADQAKQRQPMLFKMLRPVFNILFSESKRRRKSAMKILLEKRSLSRLGAIRWGIRKRAQTKGLLVSLAQTAGIFLSDCFSTMLQLVLRVVVFYPILLVSRTAKLVKTLLSKLQSKSKATPETN